MHEVEQVIEPTARIGRRPTVQLGLHLQYPNPRARILGVQRGVFWHCRPSLHVLRCRPSPCDRLSRPRSTTAAPPRPIRSAVGAPIRSPHQGDEERRAVTGRFPCSLWFVCRSRSPTMTQRPRHEYAAGFPRGLPRTLLNTVVEVLAAPSGDETHRARPRSARFEPVSGLKDVVTPVPHVLLFVSLAGPAPSGSTGTFRLVRAAPALPGTTRIRLPSATLTCCDRPEVTVFHLHSTHSASRRNQDPRQSQAEGISGAACAGGQADAVWASASRRASVSLSRSGGAGRRSYRDCCRGGAAVVPAVDSRVETYRGPAHRR